MVPVKIGKTQRENNYLSSWALISRHWMMVDSGLIRKVLETTCMEHCNGFPTPTKVYAPLWTDTNGSEAKRDWHNSYASVIGTMFYLASKKRQDIYFDVTSVPGLHITPSHHTR